MTTQPVIGVMPLYDDERESYWMLPAYMKALESCGAITMMLPLTAESATLDYFSELCDGFLFTGGHDVDAALYHEAALPQCGKPCADRDTMEYEIIRRAIAADKPLLGICRGLQILNVYFGGSLYQDIPTQFPSEIHHQMASPYDRIAHNVSIVEGSLLHQIVGEIDYGVNSYHHQAIKTLPPQLQPLAYAPDGLVEAIMYPECRFAIAVQWHPEFFYQKDEGSLRLFKAFVDACKPCG